MVRKFSFLPAPTRALKQQDSHRGSPDELYGGEKASSGTGSSGRAAAAGLSHGLIGSPQQLAPAFSCISFGLELQKKKKKGPGMASRKTS